MQIGSVSGINIDGDRALRSECLKHALGCFAPDHGADHEAVLRIAQYFYYWCDSGMSPATPLLKR